MADTPKLAAEVIELGLNADALGSRVAGEIDRRGLELVAAKIPERREALQAAKERSAETILRHARERNALRDKQGIAWHDVCAELSLAEAELLEAERAKRQIGRCHSSET